MAVKLAKEECSVMFVLAYIATHRSRYCGCGNTRNTRGGADRVECNRCGSYYSRSYLPTYQRRYCLDEDDQEGEVVAHDRIKFSFDVADAINFTFEAIAQDVDELDFSVFDTVEIMQLLSSPVSIPSPRRTRSQTLAAAPPSTKTCSRT